MSSRSGQAKWHSDEYDEIEKLNMAGDTQEALLSASLRCIARSQLGLANSPLQTALYCGDRQ
jgi:hypothetical protein